RPREEAWRRRLGGAARRGGRLPDGVRQGALPAHTDRSARGAVARGLVGVEGRREPDRRPLQCPARPQARRSGQGREAEEGRRSEVLDMLADDLPREAVQALRAHRLRSFLTLLGIIIGVATLVGVVSVITGLNGWVQEKVIVLSPDVFVVTKFGVIRSREEFLDAL